jgi:hypothetical protein
MASVLCFCLAPEMGYLYGGRQTSRTPRFNELPAYGHDTESSQCRRTQIFQKSRAYLKILGAKE